MRSGLGLSPGAGGRSDINPLHTILANSSESEDDLSHAPRPIRWDSQSPEWIAPDVAQLSISPANVALSTVSCKA